MVQMGFSATMKVLTSCEFKVAGAIGPRLLTGHERVCTQSTSFHAVNGLNSNNHMLMVLRFLYAFVDTDGILGNHGGADESRVQGGGRHWPVLEPQEEGTQRCGDGDWAGRHIRMEPGR